MKKILFLFSAFLFLGCQTVQNPELEKIPEKKSEKSEISQEIPEIPENFENIDKNLYKIARVIDGDTYEVFIDGKKEKVRVLGIDTPEKAGGFRPEGCFGNDASIYVKHQLLEQQVGLLNPKNHENTDKYGRLLRYVFLDGKDFGAHLIEEGYAWSYKKFPHDRLKYYNSLEKSAQQQKKGMWNPENCEYWEQEN